MKHKLCSAAILALAAVLLAGGSAAAQDEVQVPCHTPAYTRSAGQIVPPAVDNTQAVCTHDGSPVNGAPSLSGGDGIIQWLSDHSVVLRSILSALGSPTLPSGASTAANQTAVQSAPGTPQTKAVTVQGNASGVALPVAVGAYVWTPLGCYQITSLGSAAGLPTIPSGTKLVSISVESQAVRMRDDGTAPTSTVGLLLPVGGPWPYSGTLTAIEFIQTAASATIDYCTYR